MVGSPVSFWDDRFSGAKMFVSGRVYSKKVRSGPQGERYPRSGGFRSFPNNTLPLDPKKNITKNMKGFKVPPQKIVGEWWLITHKHATCGFQWKIYPSTFSKVPWTPWSLPQVVCTPYELSRDHQDLADTVGGTKRLGGNFVAHLESRGFRVVSSDGWHLRGLIHKQKTGFGAKARDFFSRGSNERS